ncbi:NADH dehydrogenase [ubiquinone] 1 alpha subcomplex subunit 11-like [Glandiceps talaboti]
MDDYLVLKQKLRSLADAAKGGPGYFDEPDGKDCFGKTACTTKVGTALGLTASIYAYLLQYGKLTPAQGLIQGASITLTMAAVGAVFGATTCAVTAARGKERRMNYFIGGCASGAVFGVRSHSYGMGVGMCVSLGSIAAIYKQGLMANWPNQFTLEK